MSNARFKRKNCRFLRQIIQTQVDAPSTLDNILSIDLTTNQEKILQRSQNFCGRPKTFDQFYLALDVDDTIRFYRLKEYFQMENAEQDISDTVTGISNQKDPNTIVKPPQLLKLKSLLKPPPVRNTDLDYFVSTLKREILHFLVLLHEGKSKSNLPPEELAGLSSLQKRLGKGIITVSTKKRRRICIFSKAEYLGESLRLLQDLNAYQILTKDLSTILTKKFSAITKRMLEKNTILNSCSKRYQLNNHTESTFTCNQKLTTKSSWQLSYIFLLDIKLRHKT